MPPGDLRVVPVAPDGATVERAVAMGFDQWAIVASFVAAPLVLVILWLADVIRPGSLGRHKARDTSGQPVAIWLFAAAVAFLAAMTGAVVVASIPALGVGGTWSSARRDAALLGVGHSVFGIGAGVALAWLIASTAGGAKAGLSVRWKDAWVGAGALLLIAPLVVAMLALAPMAWWWITGERPDPVAHELLKLMMGTLADPWRLMLVATAVVGAPVVEELVYRAFLQSALVRACDGAGINRWIGVVAAAAVFAGMHWSAVPVHGLVVLFVLGVCFGVAFERSGRLGVPIVMHAIFNAANIVVALGR